VSVPLELDEKKIEELARIGMSRREIADLMGCDESVIRKKYKAVYNRGFAGLRKELTEILLDMCREKHPAALIFALKNYRGMADKPEDQDPNVGTSKAKHANLKRLMEERGIVIPKK